MHIVLVADHAYINGGQAKVCIDSALGLRAAGHRVTYFAPCGPADPRLAAAGVRVECLGQGDVTNTPTFTFLRQTMWNVPAQRRLAAILAECDPADTLVHVHAWAKAASASIAPPLIASGLPRVYTFHEYFLVCPTGGFYDYRRHRPCDLTPMSLACMTTNCDQRTYARKLMRVARQELVDRTGLRDAFRHVIAISDMQRHRVGPLMASDTVWHKVDNPVDADPSAPKSAAGGDFLYVGRLSPEKGVVHFLEGARRAGVVPLIAGDGPLRTRLEAAYPEARFIGWQTPESVRALMRAARALVFPSVWMEGQPLTVLEALAAGTPVVVSDACAGRESVADGETGLWFRSGDADDLAKALMALTDDATALRMSSEAHGRYWRDPLTLARHVAALQRVYADVVAGSRDASATSAAGCIVAAA